MSDDETRDDQDVEAHKRATPGKAGLAATEEAEGDGDDVEAHRSDVGRTDAGRTDAGRTDAGRTDAG